MGKNAVDSGRQVVYCRPVGQLLGSETVWRLPGSEMLCAAVSGRQVVYCRPAGQFPGSETVWQLPGSEMLWQPPDLETA
jgi:hypothetical protein